MKKRLTLCLTLLAFLAGLGRVAARDSHPISRASELHSASEAGAGPDVKFRGTVTHIFLPDYEVHIEQVLSGGLNTGGHAWVDVWDAKHIIGSIEVGDRVEVYGEWYNSDPDDPGVSVGSRPYHYIKEIAQEDWVDIWVQEGEGSTHCIDDTIHLCFAMSGPMHLKLWVTTSEGQRLIDEWDDDGTSWCMAGTLGAPTGEHRYRVEAVEGGHVTASDETWVWVEDCSDTTPPTGRITSPEDGAFIHSCPLTIEAEASDDQSGVNLVEFHAFYDDSWHHLGNDSSRPYSWNWHCSSISDQGVWLTIHVWDNAGNEVLDPGGYVYITLDRSLPTISNVHESDDTINRDGCPEPTTVTIRADVTDESGVDWVRLHYTPPGGQETPVAMTPESGDTYKATIGPFSETGTLRYYVEAQDLADNREQSPVHSMRVQNCGSPDLDVRHTKPRLEKGRKGSEPERLVLEVWVLNSGEMDAHNVIVDVYDGHPDTGALIATGATTLIPSGTSDSVRVQWSAPHGATADLYVKVHLQSPELEENLENNITQSGTPIEVYYADFQFDPDTFNFENWSMTWWDFVQEVAAYFDSCLPQNMPFEIWRYALTPLVYEWAASGGHCYGMAQASIVFWETPLWEHPYGKAAYQLHPWEGKPAIRDHHARQLVYALERKHLGKPDAGAAYDRLLARVRQRRPAILSMFQSGTGSGHAITVYKVVEIDDKRYAFVYDPNDPMEEGETNEFTEVASFGVNSFSYGGYTTVYCNDPLLDADEYFAKVIQDVYAAILKELDASNRAQVFLGSPATALITDQYGRRIGLAEGEFINEIPGATMTDFGGAYRFELPASLRYRVVTTGTGSGTLALSFELPLGNSVVREVAYTDVPVSHGSKTTTRLSRITTDWDMELGGGQVHEPAINRKVDFLHPHAIYLPTVLRNHIPGEQPNR